MVYRYAERKELNNADRCILPCFVIMEEAGITVVRRYSVVVWSRSKGDKAGVCIRRLLIVLAKLPSRTSPRSTDDFCTTTAWWTLRLLEQGSKLIALPIN